MINETLCPLGSKRGAFEVRPCRGWVQKSSVSGENRTHPWTRRLAFLDAGGDLPEGQAHLPQLVQVPGRQRLEDAAPLGREVHVDDPVVPGVALTRHEARRRCSVHELDRPVVLEEEVVGQRADRGWPATGGPPRGQRTCG